MATISRAQLLHHPSAYFSRLPRYHSSFSINFRRRKFSVTPPLLCSSSSSSSSASTNPSIVGDLLNYLNESWTQFHATGLPNIGSLHPFLSAFVLVFELITISLQLQSVTKFIRNSLQNILFFIFANLVMKSLNFSISFSLCTSRNYNILSINMFSYNNYHI